MAEKIIQLHAALDGSSIPHAFGGALALAYYAEPRLTIDIDLNVFLDPTRHAAVRMALAPLGFDSALPGVARDGQGRVRWGRTPVDLFYAYLEFHQAMHQHVRREPFGDDEIPILAAEHLVVCKASFARAKDWLDIAEVVRSNPALQWDEVDRWALDVLGATDPRLARLRALRGG
jgi:hypothetical protein